VVFEIVRGPSQGNSEQAIGYVNGGVVCANSTNFIYSLVIRVERGLLDPDRLVSEVGQLEGNKNAVEGVRNVKYESPGAKALDASKPGTYVWLYVQTRVDVGTSRPAITGTERLMRCAYQKLVARQSHNYKSRHNIKT
jgi:hypothetical protein